MAIDFQIGGGPNGVTLGLSMEAIKSLAARFSRRPLFGGPCLIIDRHTGLALDSRTEPQARTRPVLWTPHALPWQQWRIQPAGRGHYKIYSEHAKRVLTTDRQAGDGSWVWLERDCDRREQIWRLVPTEDCLAFIVETSNSEHSLDATRRARVPAAEEDGSVSDPTEVNLCNTHKAPWQQWMILRLPLS